MSMTRSDTAGELGVVAILADAGAGALLRRTLQHTGDRLSLASDLAEGLACISAEMPDAAFVELTLGGNAGLAVVHHIRALSPNTAVFAVTRPERLELAMQAAALGSRGTLVLPLSGDDVLTALSEVRARRAEHAQPRPASGSGFGEQRLATLFGEIAELSSSASQRLAAEGLAPVLAAGFCTPKVVVYLAAGAASRQFLRVAALPANQEAPAFAEELELLRHAAQGGFEVVRLAMRREQLGLVLVGGTLPSAAIVAGAAFAATLMLALVGAREQASRGAMKDPDSSAYTFSYFVDVAGREIDMARRYGRRFALATISVHAARNPAATSREPTVEAAESVLGAVRDTDVLARVDAHEFYLLLPETGGIGAQACRRRVLDRVVGSSLDVFMGLSAFPHDGTDLSRLLRVARHRADVSSRSAAKLFGLNRLPLGALLDVLLGPLVRQAAPNDRELEAPRYIELSAMDAIGVALAALREAARAGDARVVATQHPGISIGGAVRAEVLREMEGIRLDVVDVSAVETAENADILVIVAEHVCYVLAGRSEGGLMRAVHAADPLLADAVLRRLAQATSTRLLD